MKKLCVILLPVLVPSINYNYLIDDDIIFIEDNKNGKSVTNDIKKIINQITRETDLSMDDFRIIYRDSEGMIDGIITKDGEFNGFYPIREKDFNSAKLKATKSPIKQKQSTKPEIKFWVVFDKNGKYHKRRIRAKSYAYAKLKALSYFGIKSWQVQWIKMERKKRPKVQERYECMLNRKKNNHNN